MHNTTEYKCTYSAFNEECNIILHFKRAAVSVWKAVKNQLHIIRRQQMEVVKMALSQAKFISVRNDGPAKKIHIIYTLLQSMEGQEGHSLLFERMHSIAGLPHCSIFLLQRHVQSGECLEIKKNIGMKKQTETSIKQTKNLLYLRHRALEQQLSWNLKGTDFLENWNKRLSEATNKWNKIGIPGIPFHSSIFEVPVYL